MNLELIQKLKFSYEGQHETYSLPPPLIDSLRLISNFFNNSKNNKLCIVFPSREYAAQWILISSVLFLIESDFSQFENEISESYKQYKSGDKLILNNKAIVEWVGIIEKENKGINFSGPTFITKDSEKSPKTEITIKFSDIKKLQRAPLSKKALSSSKTVKESLSSGSVITPIEKLLHIKTWGNTDFLKNNICLISKFKSYDDSIANVLMNDINVIDYFKPGKIDESGKINESSSFLISNNFANLILYLSNNLNPVPKKIIIDGFNAITPLGDFSSIDREFNIPTILITDLSEIETFGQIKNHKFEFFNFSKENITLNDNSKNSPFEIFERKLNKYISFKPTIKVFNNPELESISQKLISLSSEDFDENADIKWSLIKFFNQLSRICYVPTEEEIANIKSMINDIESHFRKCYLWTGEARKTIEDSVTLLKNFLHNFPDVKTEKCAIIEELLQQKNYDYIICPTGEEAGTLRKHIAITKVISVADVNDNILSDKEVRAILTGWPKAEKINSILSSFLFSELIILFYQFENRYYMSLQKRNRKNIENIKSIITKDEVHCAAEGSKSGGFENLYTFNNVIKTSPENSFDIVEYELKLDKAQYSKYFAQGNKTDSCQAKRIDFENETLIYATESHKFLVINDLIDPIKSNPDIRIKKNESLHSGDIIAFINTDRNVLVELVQKNTRPDEFADIKKWTDSWKTLLRNYFASIGNDFNKLVDGLKKMIAKNILLQLEHGCRTMI